MTDRTKSEKTGVLAECPSCHNVVEFLRSKTGRLLFLCSNCRLQVFDRGDGCKPWFAQLVRNYEGKKK